MFRHDKVVTVQTDTTQKHGCSHKQKNRRFGDSGRQLLQAWCDSHLEQIFTTKISTSSDARQFKGHSTNLHTLPPLMSCTQ